MPKFTYQDLKNLVSQESKIAISIYLPLHKTGPETREDPIRFKKLLKEAEKMAQSKGYAQANIDTAINSFKHLEENQDYWSKTGANSGAFFTSENYNLIILSSENFRQEVTVNKRFSIKQLLQMLTSNKQFFILVISKQKNRFLICDKYNCEEVEIPSLPKDIEDALGLEMINNTLQSHTSGSPGVRGRSETTFHGQGSYKDEEQDKTKRYLNEISKALYNDYLHSKNEPLILASVKEYLPIFTEVSEYKNIVGEVIPGNHDNTNTKDLHEKALKIINPILNEEANVEFKKYKSTRGKESTTNDLIEIIKLAYMGRIEKLFVHDDFVVWGDFNPKTGEAILQTEQSTISDDLAELASFFTIINGGNVYMLNPEKYELKNKISAILRF